MSPARAVRSVRPKVSGEELEARTLCLRLKLGKLGVHAKVRDKDKNEKVTVDADKAAIQVTKDIVESAELLEILRLDAEVRGYVYAMSITPSWLRGGFYLEPVAATDTIEERLADFKAKRLKLVAAFIKAYPRLKEEAKAKLRALYDERDYPTVAAVEAAFTWEQQWLAFGAPEQLKGVNKELFEQERKRMAAMWEGAVQEVTTLLRAEMKGLVDKMVDRLSPGPDGKKKRIYDSLVTNMGEFLDTVDLRNVVDDKELAALTARARRLLNGVDADDLRDAQKAEIVAAGFEEIKSLLDPLVEEAPSRSIRFAS